MTALPAPGEPNEADLGQRVSAVVASLMQPKRFKVKSLAAAAEGVTYNSFRERYNAGTLTIEDLQRIAVPLETSPARILELAQGFPLPRYLTSVHGTWQTSLDDLLDAEAERPVLTLAR